jgi:hypothetical protein
MKEVKARLEAPIIAAEVEFEKQVKKVLRSSEIAVTIFVKGESKKEKKDEKSEVVYQKTVRIFQVPELVHFHFIDERVYIDYVEVYPIVDTRGSLIPFYLGKKESLLLHRVIETLHKRSKVFKIV